MVHLWSTERKNQDFSTTWKQARDGRQNIYNSLNLQVPEVGIEPTRGCPHGILSPNQGKKRRHGFFSTVAQSRLLQGVGPFLSVGRSEAGLDGFGL